VTLSPKTTNALEQYEVRRTGILNLCPNVTLFTWLERLREHFHKEITTLSSLFWTEQWKPMSIAKISELLTLLIKKIGIEGFTAYSIKHASTTKLAAMGI
jgi:site-specific recombinase XerD